MRFMIIVKASIEIRQVFEAEDFRRTA